MLQHTATMGPFASIAAMYAPPAWWIAVGAALTALAAAGALYAWPWSRERRRMLVGAGATVVGFLVWRGALIVANGANLDIDYDVLLGLSFEDIGSGVMSFLFATLAFGLWTDRGEPAQRVVTAAGLVGLAAIVVDRFV